MNMIDTVRCEVYNASYEPLSVVSGRRGLIIALKGKATVIAEHPSLILNTGTDVFAIPTKIVLKTMVKTRSTTTIPAQLTQRNLFIRDRWTCQYCNRHRSELKQNEKLTRDHVVPTSRGGRDEWKNVTTACNRCNHRKADTVLDGLDMTLLSDPHVPTVFEIWSKSKSHFKVD